MNRLPIRPIPQAGVCRRYVDVWRGELRQRWYLYGPLLLIWTLAYLRLLVDPTPHLPLLFNWTPSLPYRVAWLQAGPGPWQRGELIVYRFDGPAQAFAPGLRGQPLFKQVRGLPGDTISVSDREVAINGQLVGRAKTTAHNGHPLAPIAGGRIPPGHYYVQGSSPDAFDSRYQAIGLVRADQVIGRVRPLW